MDPITTAIVTTAGTGLAAGIIKDSYEALKAALQKKFGSESDLVDAVDKLEKKPDLKARKDMVKEEVEIAKVNDDPEILKLAEDLLEKIKQQPGGQQTINQTQTSTMSGNTVGGSVTFTLQQEGKNS